VVRVLFYKATWTEKTIESLPFLPNTEIIAAVETWLDGQPSEF
jgi:hypothetical protein